jgi:hypothetical protein
VDDLDQFRITLQQLEIARELVLTRGEMGCRVSLILLDNVAETILYRIIQSEFESDDFTRTFVPEQYPPKARRQVERVFAHKLNAVAKARRLPGAVVTTLLILHTYRNAAYHRDTHNPVVLPLLARVALIAVADLFARTRAGIRISGAGGHQEPIDWLERYGVGKAFVDFDAAARSIARQLKARVRPTLPVLLDGFAADITSRTAAVRRVLTERLPAPDEQETNRMLKWFEFRHANPDLESKLSADHRALNYKISSRRGADVTRDEYIEAETRFRASYKSAHEQYQPQLTYSGLAAIEAVIPELYGARNYRGALQRYAALDVQVTMFEEVTSAAHRQFEYQVEMESNIRRGK